MDAGAQPQFILNLKFIKSPCAENEAHLNSFVEHISG
jgi:hypothetical protein